MTSIIKGEKVSERNIGNQEKQKEGANSLRHTNKHNHY